jgi:uracil-DNA glycosylase
VKKFSLDEVHPSWEQFFTGHIDAINEILASLPEESATPTRDRIFRAFSLDLEKIKVVIFGQDPYPGVGVADGLAFSSPLSIQASLRNIFTELSDDVKIAKPTSADLSPWAERGVLLLNRSLTTVVGERNAHVSEGWHSITLSCAQYLGERDVVAILWGSYAQQLSHLFNHSISSAHPSPLSAYRGFFGSKPFSRANKELISLGKEPVDWSL